MDSPTSRLITPLAPPSPLPPTTSIGLTGRPAIGAGTAAARSADMLTEVQRKIYGQRSEKLSPVEINRLFQSPATPEFNLTLYQALQRDAINPDVTILQAIPRAKTREYLIPIALCLRFGADANMYVNAPNIGTVHILGYVYNVLGGGRFEEVGDAADTDVLNTIVLMLIAKGSRPTLPMFDRNAGKIRPEPSMRTTSISVAEWLNEQGYTTILDRIITGQPSDLQKVVDADSLAILSILLDMTNLMAREYESRDALMAIRAFSPLSFEKIPISETVVIMDNKSLDDSVTYLNSAAYDRIVKLGKLPSYLLINKILVNMRMYKERGRVLALQELEKMLISSVNVGTQLDQDQLAIISTMGRDILDSLLKTYEQPYWRKVCKAPGSTVVPEPLRRLAVSLNVDPTMSKAAICESLNNLSRADKEALKEAARRRQQLRISSDMGTMNEFLGGKMPNVVCVNKGLLPHDPLDYNDIDIAYYRDDQGAVWCFTSDTFASILESGLNPYNSTILPDSFKDELKYRIDALKRLGVNTTTIRTPITYSKSLDSLADKDVINEKTSSQAVDIFIQLANKNNISSETIKTLSKDKMMAALRSIGQNIDLAPLSTSHALVTTAHIVEYLNRTDLQSIPIFFSSLNMGSF